MAKGLEGARSDHILWRAAPLLIVKQEADHCQNCAEIKTKAAMYRACLSFVPEKRENAVSWPNLPENLDDPLKPTRGQCQATVSPIREQVCFLKQKQKHKTNNEKKCNNSGGKKQVL